MESETEYIQKTAKTILEFIYEMYVKDLKSGNILNNKGVVSFGKICKKRKSFDSDDPTLFNYGDSINKI